MKVGLRDIESLRERSKFDPRTLCWHWLGAKSDMGQPRLYAFCHAQGKKRTMACCTAVWNIAHGESPRGIPFHTCKSMDCVNPVHVRVADSFADVMQYRSKAGYFKGTAVDQRIQNIKKAHLARGVEPMEDSIVLAIRNEWKNRTGREISIELGVSEQTVSKIRMGKSYRHLLPISDCVESMGA